VARLNQIIAVSKSVKSKAQRDITDAYQQVQKPALLSGISRTYRPKDDEGEQLPPESTKVQINVEDVLRDVRSTLTRLFDVVATQDWANTTARADVVVDGTAVLPQVPVTYLLFLEKQLVDIRTFISKLPTLDPSKDWEVSVATGGWATRPAETVRTAKLPRNHVLAEATEKHPAQVQVYTEDVVVGTWTKVEFSGGVPATRVRELIDRVDKLADAVKYAREAANNSDVDDQHVGASVFTYLFGPA
jgi:ACT domain-containing protein